MEPIDISDLVREAQDGLAARRLDRIEIIVHAIELPDGRFLTYPCRAGDHAVCPLEIVPCACPCHVPAE